jgi:hypothetical protein
MAESILRFWVPREVEGLEFADLPQSVELSDVVYRLQLECLGDLHRISVRELRRTTKAAKAVTLELGCLVRRAKRGEFGKLPGEVFYTPNFEYVWPTPWPGEAPGEQIEIPAAAMPLPLAIFEMTGRLRNILYRLGFEHASDLNGRQYCHFLRLQGVGGTTAQDLRILVQRIREGRPGTPRPVAQKKAPIPPPCFVVPQTLKDIIPYDLPISARLDGILRRMGIARLGDLVGIEYREMLAMLGCGQKTLREALQLLERASLN